MKRVIGDSNSEPPKKRRKAQAAATEDTIIPEADKVTNAPWVIDPDQVFRFLDLPGGQSLLCTWKLNSTD